MPRAFFRDLIHDVQPEATEGITRELVGTFPPDANYLTEQDGTGFHVYRTFGPSVDLGRGADGNKMPRQTTGVDAAGYEENGHGAESWVGSRKHTTGYRIEDRNRMRRTRDENGNGDLTGMLQQLNGRMDRIERALVLLAGGAEEGNGNGEETSSGDILVQEQDSGRRAHGTRDAMASIFRPSPTIARINARNRKHYHIN